MIPAIVSICAACAGAGRIERGGGTIVTDPETGQTGNSRYFAGGDCANGGRGSAWSCSCRWKAAALELHPEDRGGGLCLIFAAWRDCRQNRRSQSFLVGFRHRSTTRWRAGHARVRCGRGGGGRLSDGVCTECLLALFVDGLARCAMGLNNIEPISDRTATEFARDGASEEELSLSRHHCVADG